MMDMSMFQQQSSKTRQSKCRIPAAVPC